MTQVPNQSFSPGLEPHRGVLILVLGILSIVLCAFIGPFAWLMGKGDLRKMSQGHMDPTGQGLTQGGMICGIVGTILLGLGIVIGIVYIIIILLFIGGAAAAGAAGAGMIG